MVRSAWDRACEAVHRGDTAQLTELLAVDPALAQACDADGATLLVLLLDWPGHRRNAAATAEVLLAAGTPVDGRRDDSNGTPLSAAVCTVEPDVVAVLLDAGADPHAANGWRAGTVLDLVDELAEDLAASERPDVRSVIEAFSAHTGDSLPRRPGLAAASPVFGTHDLHAAVGWYRRVLGFGEPEWHPDAEAATYAILGRGAVHLHLAQVPADTPTGAAGFVVQTSDVAAVHRAAVAAGAEPAQPLTDQPWGWTDFVLRDPDGYSLRIGA
ncbi:MAG: putative glyoxalase superfamily protein PhnB, partial [Myxococcota bacterium]